VIATAGTMHPTGSEVRGQNLYSARRTWE